jgi:hypothetical protein
MRRRPTVVAVAKQARVGASTVSGSCAVSRCFPRWRLALRKLSKVLAITRTRLSLSSPDSKAYLNCILPLSLLATLGPTALHRVRNGFAPRRAQLTLDFGYGLCRRRRRGTFALGALPVFLLPSGVHGRSSSPPRFHPSSIALAPATTSQFQHRFAQSHLPKPTHYLHCLAVARQSQSAPHIVCKNSPSKQCANV